ncbi:hypothetical protein [Chlorogloeopsis fritschii]|uniref:hypothetical protein n=1 Tax=Chlorogloeopsis fritschii TaxID=1124 RepID=UPI0023F0A7FF|nr:hypothetical protein [Chlorogloeopsis fritschii]
MIGLYLSAPYLHDGGVTASSDAFKQDENGHFVVANPKQLGMAGTLMRGISPDAESSLRSLVDRNLREPMVAANKANSNLQRSNITGQGHPYWVDQQAGFTTQQQTDLIKFLLSIDDDPAVLP